jgi:hypothetical protein
MFAYDLSWSRNWVACSRQPASATGSATNAIKSICISSAHGVRKATAAALPEAGKSVHEIAAVTGHLSLERMKKLTDTAIAKLK